MKAETDILELDTSPASQHRTIARLNEWLKDVTTRATSVPPDDEEDEDDFDDDDEDLEDEEEDDGIDEDATE